jgi:hypothetical protein
MKLPTWIKRLFRKRLKVMTYIDISKPKIKR